MLSKSKLMVHSLLISLFLVFGLNFGYSQYFDWAQSFGGAENDESRSITVDEFGYVYTTGIFKGTVDFDPGSNDLYLTSQGGWDVFVQKTDSIGNLIWAKSFGGTEHDFGESIDVDASGNVFVSGGFGGTADFDPGTGVSNLTSEGIQDVFVQKMDASGNFLWAKSFGGVDSDGGNGVAIDNDGNVYTTGYFEGEVDFDPGTGTEIYTSLEESWDVFVHKMDASGNFLWVKTFGYVFLDEGTSIDIDGDGNVYTTGNFMGTVDFDPSNQTEGLASHGYLDVFVQKLDDSGNFLWAKSFGGSEFDRGDDINVDAFGNVLTIGRFDSSVDFDPGEDTHNLYAAGVVDGYVHKMDASGNFLWVKPYSSPQFDVGVSVTTDNDGNVYVNGLFSDAMDFDPGPNTLYITPIGMDVFVQKLNPSGDFLWVKTFGGPNDDWCTSIATDAVGNVYTTGYFNNTIDFDPGDTEANLTSNGESDIYIQKLSGSSIGIQNVHNDLQITAYPNPSKGNFFVRFGDQKKDVNLIISDALGKIVYTKHYKTTSETENIHLSNVENGIYFLTLKCKNQQSVIKINITE